MNTVASSQKNRRERIAEAMRIEWNGFVDTYSTDLWLNCVDSMVRFQEEPNRETCLIWFGGEEHHVTKTPIENLMALCRQSYDRQQMAKAVR